MTTPYPYPTRTAPEGHTMSTAAIDYTISIHERPCPDMPHRAVVLTKVDGTVAVWAVFYSPEHAAEFLNIDDTDPAGIPAAARAYIDHVAA